MRRRGHESKNETPLKGARLIPVDKIVPDRSQPRAFSHHDSRIEALAHSIKSVGILQPLLVQPEEGNGTFRILAGSRRFKAARLAKCKTVPCLVFPDLNDGERLACQIVENVHRVGLHWLATARTLIRLREEMAVEKVVAPEEIPWTEVDRKIGISERQRQRILQILDLPFGGGVRVIHPVAVL